MSVIIDILQFLGFFAALTLVLDFLQKQAEADIQSSGATGAAGTNYRQEDGPCGDDKFLIGGLILTGNALLYFEWAIADASV